MNITECSALWLLTVNIVTDIQLHEGRIQYWWSVIYCLHETLVILLVIRVYTVCLLLTWTVAKYTVGWLGIVTLAISTAILRGWICTCSRSSDLSRSTGHWASWPTRPRRVSAIDCKTSACFILNNLNKFNTFEIDIKSWVCYGTLFITISLCTNSPYHGGGCILFIFKHS